MTETAPQPLIILGKAIMPGESRTINMDVAKLHTTTELKIPVIVERSLFDGPVVLFTAGIHGDEINGVEVVRQLITQKINRPKIGTIICIPIVNMFGFVNHSREFPDGRDLNRVFPGNKNGSLASRFAYTLIKEILPVVNYCVDFHAGGASRFNAPQIRIAKRNIKLKKLAEVFNAPFTVYSKNIAGSFRSACAKLNIRMLLYEGGKSLDINREVALEGVEGSKRILSHLEMLDEKHTVKSTKPSIFLERTSWIRAKSSGLFIDHSMVSKYVKKGEVLGLITDPFGKFEHKVKAPHDGYIINANHAPIVYEGDAIYHISHLPPTENKPKPEIKVTEQFNIDH